MTFSIDNEASATVVISHRVKDEHQSSYEKWLDEIVPIAKAYPGHLGAVIIRPVPGATTTYTVVIRFDTRDHLLAWMGSQDRLQLIDKVQPLLAEDDQFTVRSGLDFWFTPEGAKVRLPRRWKQFLVTWSAIYPLVIGVSMTLEYLLQNFHIYENHYLKLLFTTGIVVLLMVYVVMPRYTQLVHRWLFH